MEQQDRDRDRIDEPGGPGEASAGAANTPPFRAEGPRPPLPEDEEGRDRVEGGPGEEPMEGIAPSSRGREEEPHAADRAGELRERLNDARFRAENRINEVLGQAADGLENAARQLDRFADRQGADVGGAGGRAGRVADSAAYSLDSAARYLRDSDAQRLQRDLEQRVREKPLQTLLIGVAAGWILGKILR